MTDVQLAAERRSWWCKTCMMRNGTTEKCCCVDYACLTTHSRTVVAVAEGACLVCRTCGDSDTPSHSTSHHTSAKRAAPAADDWRSAIPGPAAAPLPADRVSAGVLGSGVDHGGAWFRVWAPNCRQACVLVRHVDGGDGGAAARWSSHELHAEGDRPGTPGDNLPRTRR